MSKNKLHVYGAIGVILLVVSFQIIGFLSLPGGKDYDLTIYTLENFESYSALTDYLTDDSGLYFLLGSRFWV